MDENSLIFGLESASRELCPVVGDADVVRFLGTTGAIFISSYLIQR